MIKLSGFVKRAFVFPASPPITMAYYSELSHIAQFLPHISLVEEYGANQIRVLYQSVELGAYTINIFCDLQSIVNIDDQVLYVRPLAIIPPVLAQANLNTTSGQGYFTIDTTFHDLGEQTHIEYKMKLNAELPRPRGMRLMPRRVVNRIAKSITDGRIREIADGFIKQSLDAFPAWLAH